jgi:beta-glucosidase/6-phospho-beta-glucosidase/beta-galactosidase
VTDSPFLRADGFSWCVGIEDTFIGQPIRHSGYALDEYELTQHYRFWRDDLDRAASLGVQGIRYGIPWYRVHPAPGRFEWGWVDDVIEYAVHAKGLMVIADLVHYGVPSWIEGGFADEAYPAAVADYASTFARRYRSLVQHYTPLNEPIITAQFCGRRGLWPPYLVGDEGWVRVVLGVVAGIQSSIAAIRRADDQAVIVHVEAARQVDGSDDLVAQVQREALLAFLPTDLVLGSVDRDHPLTKWLLASGATMNELDALRSQRARIDVLGINYYPDFSRRELVRHDGTVAEVAVDGGPAGLKASLTVFHDRYGLPLFVSETSTDGDDARRIAWLRASVTAVGDLRAAGVPVRGYTWWPLFDFVDWSHSIGDRRMEDFLVRRTGLNGVSAFVEPFQPTGTPGSDPTPFLRRMGLWRLERHGDHLRRIETPAAEELRKIVQRVAPTDVKAASRRRLGEATAANADQ